MCRIDFGRIIMPDKYKKNITVRNDSVAMVNGTLAYYNPQDDAIYVRKGDMKMSDFFGKTFKESDTDKSIIVIHERQHQINAHKGCGQKKMSLSERYQETMHDEITASIAEKLEIRRQYKAAKNDQERTAVLQKYAGERKHASYLKAIKDGQVNPNSTSSKDFSKEMGMIKDSATDFWVRHDAIEYQDKQELLVRGFLAKNGNGVRSNPEALQSNLKQMYNIGGIDFTAYGKDNFNLPVRDQMIDASQTFLEQGADPKKLDRFMRQGAGNYKTAESLDYTGLSYQQAEKVVQTAMMRDNLSEELAGSMALGESTKFDFNYLSREGKREAAVYLDVKSDIWEKNGTLSAEGDEEKYNRLMEQAKEIKLDPQQWYENNKRILNVAKDPSRADELAELQNRITELQGKTVSLDEAVDNMDQFKLPLDGTSKDEVLDEMQQEEDENIRFNEEYAKKYPEKERISEAYNMEITDLESDLLKDELKDIEEAEREEALKKEKEAEEKRKREEEQKKKEEEERKKQEEQQQQPEQPNQAQQQAQQGQAAEQNSPLQTEGENSFEGAGEASNESDTSSEESGASSAGENDNKQTAENSVPDNEYADKAGTIVTQRVEPLSTAPKPKSTPYRILDGFKGYFSSNSSPQYKNAEMKSTINQDGSRTDALYIDGKKHGAEISQDKNGEITDVKAYDHGKPMNLNGHKIDVRSDEKEINGKKIKTNQVALDGKPFGAVTAESSDGTVKADFYDKNGQRMSGAKGAKITKTTEYAPAAPAQQQDQTQAAENTSKPQQSETRAQQQKPAQPTENQTAPAETEQSQQRKTQPQEQTQTQAAGQQVEVSKPENYAHEVQDNMKKGHNRIAEMRAKLAAGHSEKLSAESEESPAEKLLREKRYESAHQSRKTVTPTRINAQQMESMLSAYEYK